MKHRTEYDSLRQTKPCVTLLLRCSGFTLIELMIVTVIVGLLSGLALPEFDAVRQRALQRRRERHRTFARSLDRLLAATVSNEVRGTAHEPVRVGVQGQAGDSGGTKACFTHFCLPFSFGSEFH